MIFLLLSVVSSSVLLCICLYVCLSELQDMEPSAGPEAAQRPMTSLTSSLPATKSQVQQTAADIQRQLEVCTGLTLYVVVAWRNMGWIYVILMGRCSEWWWSRPPLGKGKVKRTCIAPLMKLHLKALRYGSHRVAPANYTIPASTLRTFARWRHLNGKHLIPVRYSFIDPEGWKAELA